MLDDIRYGVTIGWFTYVALTLLIACALHIPVRTPSLVYAHLFTWKVSVVIVVKSVSTRLLSS
jgi:hypothetical protein